MRRHGTTNVAATYDVGKRRWIEDAATQARVGSRAEASLVREAARQSCPLAHLVAELRQISKTGPRSEPTILAMEDWQDAFRRTPMEPEYAASWAEELERRMEQRRPAGHIENT
jgi:hypothetical protein